MDDLYIMHYGVGHDKGGHSGRYPWGSGDNKIVKTAKAIKERGINDVIAEGVARRTQKRMGQSEEEFMYNKERVKAILKNVEAYTITTLVGTTLGIGGTLALRGYYTYKDIQKANKDVDNFIDNYQDVNLNSIKEDRR